MAAGKQEFLTMEGGELNVRERKGESGRKKVSDDVSGAKGRGGLSEGDGKVDRKVGKDKEGEQGNVLRVKSGEKEGGEQEVGVEEGRYYEDVVVKIGRDIQTVAEIVNRSPDDLYEVDQSMALEVLVGVMGAVNELAARQMRMERKMMEMELKTDVYPNLTYYRD